MAEVLDNDTRKGPRTPDLIIRNLEIFVNSVIFHHLSLTELTVLL